ncbi:aminotransferase class V-fold PLP-dependent enzyme [Clostridium sp.]|jgi:selenocysteine lyase/cysteine desulfurase|uniref:aminotransferase class V-fold PLP-dependent enzyme n=1 Tax=Clostridium sp. TaxID=1506 RepID=UPI00258F171E|nr:aminotransferase class V-fold PLP-dependent enzyme [Clostridium sp.]MDF2505286.1 aminotransferase class [Clostridium sp.]
MNEYKNGLAFEEELIKEIKDKFFYVDSDPISGKRLFFDNAGGAFRLKKAVEKQSELEAFPDCPERDHEMSHYLQRIMKQGQDDIKLMLNAKNGGSILTSLTASQVMFQIVGTIAENVAGTNMVTTVLEHPSAFDAVDYYARKTGRELRVAMSNKDNGKVEVEDVIKLIDEDTVLLSLMHASNLSGAVFDVEEIIKKARLKKPGLFVIVDAVQHAPHGIIDLEKTPVDGINFGPYKFFGCRGSGIGYVSDRVSAFSHHKIIAKGDEVWALGTPTPAQFAVITQIVDYICWIGGKFSDSKDRRALYVEGINRIKLQERALLNRLLEGTAEIEGLRKQKNVKVYADNKDLTSRDLIVGIGFENMDCASAAKEYEKRKVILAPRLVSSIYSKRMLDSFGIKDGVLRVSPLHCHSVKDIDEFLAITKEIGQL